MQEPVQQPPRAPTPCDVTRAIVGQDFTKLLVAERESNIVELEQAVDDPCLPPVVRNFAAHILVRVDHEKYLPMFVASYPHDIQSISWMADWDFKILRSKDSALDRICQNNRSCDVSFEANETGLLIATAAEGDARAMSVFAGSWLEHSDGAVAELICTEFVPLLIKRRPALLMEVVATNAKASAGLKGCADSMLVDALQPSGVARLARTRVSGADARALLREIVELLRHPDPDWP